MKTRRRLLLAIGAGALAIPLAAFGQQKVWRIGFMGVDSAADFGRRLDVFREGLRDVGYVEGKNIVIEFRWAEGRTDRLPALAAELVQLKVDVIVCYGTPGTRAAKEATSTIPIVSARSGDLVGNGLVASLARPGGNITGSTFFSEELMLKRLELLKEALPKVTQVGVLINPDNPSQPRELRGVAEAGKAIKVVTRQFDARLREEIGGAFSDMARSRVHAALIFDDSIFVAKAAEIAEHATKARLPAIGTREFAEAGGLMGYDTNRLEAWRRAGVFIDKILKGAKPGELPIERATRFDLVVNLKTAKALGLSIPQSILVRADRVIE